MKRILALLLALLLLFCTFGCNEEPPENTEQPPADYGEIVSDGNIKYHTGQLICDIYPEENKIFFAFDNRRNTAIYCSMYDVQVQKWENEQWTFYPLLVPFRDIPDAYSTLSAHKKSNPISISIYPHAVTPGRYRLISKGGSDGAGTIYWMGEFTITEEQAAAYPDESDLYYDENVGWQSNAVSPSVLPATEEPYLYEFALQNNGTGKLVIPHQVCFAWIWNESRNEWLVGAANWHQVLPEADTLIHPGDTFRFPLCKEGGSSDYYIPQYNAYYRFTIEYHWEENVDCPFFATFYFRVQDGVITEEKPPVPDTP